MFISIKMISLAVSRKSRTIIFESRKTISRAKNRQSIPKFGIPEVEVTPISIIIPRNQVRK